MVAATNPKASDFLPGEYVKIVGPFPRSEWAHLRQFIGWYGRVGERIPPSRLVTVTFYPRDVGYSFPPAALERGALTWTSVGDTS